MEYMSCAEAAGKWGISERRVQKLCEGTHTESFKIWQYVADTKSAEKPIDGRTKKERSNITNEAIIFTGR